MDGLVKMSWQDILKISDYEKEVAREFTPEEMGDKRGPSRDNYNKTHQQRKLDTQEDLVKYVYLHIKKLPTFETWEEFDKAKDGLYRMTLYSQGPEESVFAIRNGKEERVVGGQPHYQRWVIRMLHKFRGDLSYD